MSENIGHVIQIAGPAVDVQFTEVAIPLIYTALRVISEGFKVPQPIDVILEVQQHLGEGRVRCVAMQPTEGMVRGMNAIDLGGPIRMPVGKETLGRVLNVIGDPVDNLGPIGEKTRMPIHRPAPLARGEARVAHRPLDLRGRKPLVPRIHRHRQRLGAGPQLGAFGQLARVDLAVGDAP